MQKAPLAIVKDRFKSKDALVSAIRDLGKGDLWLDRESKSGLDRAPSRKLLKLHDTLTDAKKRFGSREKIIDALATAEGRVKDKDFKNRFATWSVPRLVDQLKASEKRAKPAAAKPAAKAPKAASKAAKSTKK
jgi:hypothetical protein